MSEPEFKKMFARNLTFYINASGKTQAEVARALHLNKATLSSWCTGIRTPRMDKVDLLCEYFGIKRSDLMEDHLTNGTGSSPAASSVSPLTPEESDVISAYRALSDEGKDMVCGMLHVNREDGVRLLDSQAG